MIEFSRTFTFVNTTWICAKFGSRYAAFFASQTQLYAQATSDFVPSANEASRITWSNMRLLLEVSEQKVTGLHVLRFSF